MERRIRGWQLPFVSSFHLSGPRGAGIMSVCRPGHCLGTARCAGDRHRLLYLVWGEGNLARNQARFNGQGRFSSHLVRFSRMTGAETPACMEKPALHGRRCARGGHSGQFISRGLLVVAEMPGGHAFIRGGEPLSQYAEFAHACKKWNKAENKLCNKFAVLNRTTFPPVQNVLVCFFPYGIVSAAGRRLPGGVQGP